MSLFPLSLSLSVCLSCKTIFGLPNAFFLLRWFLGSVRGSQVRPAALCASQNDSRLFRRGRAGTDGRTDAQRGWDGFLRCFTGLVEGRLGQGMDGGRSKVWLGWRDGDERQEGGKGGERVGEQNLGRPGGHPGDKVQRWSVFPSFAFFFLCLGFAEH